jgi:protease I
VADELRGRRVAILATDGVERVELEQVRRALDGAGARTVVVSRSGGAIRVRDPGIAGFDTADPGTVPVDQLVGAASVEDYDALLLPGGTVTPPWGPDALRFLRDFVLSGKPIASIRPGPWDLVEAVTPTPRSALAGGAA